MVAERRVLLTHIAEYQASRPRIGDQVMLVEEPDTAPVSQGKQGRVKHPFTKVEWLCAACLHPGPCLFIRFRLTPQLYQWHLQRHLLAHKLLRDSTRLTQHDSPQCIAGIDN